MADDDNVNIGNFVPIKVVVLIDNEQDTTNTDSILYQVVTETLKLNKIPFNILNISDLEADALIDDYAKVKYSVLLMMIPGWKLDSERSQYIIDAVQKGMGVVVLLSDSTNKFLNPVLGIENQGNVWTSASSIRILKDKFTFSYSNVTIYGEFPYLDNILLPGVEVIARFNEYEQAAIWVYKYGKGKIIYHNHTSAWTDQYTGILLQSILYSMPIGVASQINAGAIEADDCPRAYYSPEQLKDWHYEFYLNFKQWLMTYNLTASFYTAFSYSGNTNDFWKFPESLWCAHDIISSGFELGLHCGKKHMPLDKDYWGNSTEIDAEVDVMMSMVEELRYRMKNNFDTELPEITSYVAPMNLIGNYGYDSLDENTDIKYVGTIWPYAEDTLNGNISVPDYAIEYPATLRYFGFEKDLDIYNLSRHQGDFYDFSEPEFEKYEHLWNIFRSRIESGDSYLIFTHPDEITLLNKGRYTDPTMEKLFEAMTIWGDYVSNNYPFYRWYTASQLGGYLETREGFLNAEWFPESNMLKLFIQDNQDAIHIKTDMYLKEILKESDYLIFKLSNSRVNYSSDEYDVVNIKQDYFIYPKNSKFFRPVIPEEPITFIPATITLNDTLNNHAGERSYAPIVISMLGAGIVFSLSVALIKKVGDN